MMRVVLKSYQTRGTRRRDAGIEFSEVFLVGCC